MPPNAVATQSSTYRRSTASSRHRENRPQTPVSGSSRRRRSRSPDSRVAEDAHVNRVGEANTHRRKKKSGAALSTHQSNNRPLRDSVASDEVPSEQPRKPRHKHRPHSQLADEPDTQAQPETQSSKNKRRDASVSREHPHRSTPKPAMSEPSGGEEDDADLFTQEDIHCMRKELEDMRRQLLQAEKKNQRHNKELEKLRKELANTQKINNEHSTQLTKLKSQSKKADELITCIEGHMNCQICMDILARPYGLSPCGHALCLNCLQEWFRTAVPDDDDMDDDGMLDSLLYRKKICPVCRTRVRTRPIPLFVVKSIASAFDKHKAGQGAPRHPSPPPDGDPWAGIFLDPSIEIDEELEDDEDIDDEEDYDDHWSSDGYGTDGDDDYQGAYIHARWAPPNGQIAPQDYHYLDEIEASEQLNMIRRGCTLQMINLFQMSYSHETGLKALIDGQNSVYLGWNVDLRPEDESGEEFMDWITNDIHERPERWDRQAYPDGAWTAWRLVREDEEREFDTTDSETWFDGPLGEDGLEWAA